MFGPKRRASPIERLILIAIVAILTTLILPNLQRASRRARTTRPNTSTSAVDRRHAPESAGQLNTIRVGPMATPGARGDGRNPARSIGVLVRLLVFIGIIMAVAAAIKQTVKRHQRQGPE